MVKISKSVSWDLPLFNRIAKHMDKINTDNFSEGVNDYIGQLEHIIVEQREAIERLSQQGKTRSLINPMKP